MGKSTNGPLGDNPWSTERADKPIVQHVLQIEEVNKLHSIITSIQVENSLARERTLAAEEQLKAMKELLASHASRNVVSEY